VCWFSLGRERQVLQRNNEASLAAFRRAFTVFEDFTTRKPSAPAAGRAQYMRGSTRFFMGELPRAESEYALCFEKYPGDAKYAPKALERRASVRRHLLKVNDALADLDLYVQRFAKGEDIESVRLHKSFGPMYGKDAPPLDVETWVQGQPTTLEALRGEIVALYFFATWCDNCEKARPFMLDLFARYEPFGVRMIGVVNHSQGQTVEKVRTFVLEEGYRMPVFMDASGTNARYGSTKIPHLVLIDRVGRVRWRDNPGNFQDATLEALLVEDPAKPLPK
jgi:thiol-disulfide isomerase/thioredoxin